MLCYEIWVDWMRMSLMIPQEWNKKLLHWLRSKSTVFCWCVARAIRKFVKGLLKALQATFSYSLHMKSTRTRVHLVTATPSRKPEKLKQPNGPSPMRSKTIRKPKYINKQLRLHRDHGCGPDCQPLSLSLHYRGIHFACARIQQKSKPCQAKPKPSQATPGQEPSQIMLKSC